MIVHAHRLTRTAASMEMGTRMALAAASSATPTITSITRLLALQQEERCTVRWKMPSQTCRLPARHQRVSEQFRLVHTSVSLTRGAGRACMPLRHTAAPDSSAAHLQPGPLQRVCSPAFRLRKPLQGFRPF